ncbi:MAG: hypothetical protein QXW79_01400 [Thermoplasmata archaeon]
MYNSYSKICDHLRLVRLNENFVKCLGCGQSIVNQIKIAGNKNRKDFERENWKFIKNFNRNFNNNIEEVEQSTHQPHYEYYIDHRGLNLIRIDRSLRFYPLYEIIVNGKRNYLNGTQIEKMLADINATRIDEHLAKKIFRNKI